MVRASGERRAIWGRAGAIPAHGAVGGGRHPGGLCAGALRVPVQDGFAFVILPLSLPGVAVTVILGFMFCWNAFSYPLMLAGRQTFPVTVGAIQFISYEQVLWGQMAAATIVAALPQLLLSLMVQKYIVCGLTMGAVR